MDNVENGLETFPNVFEEDHKNKEKVSEFEIGMSSKPPNVEGFTKHVNEQRMEELVEVQ